MSNKYLIQQEVEKTLQSLDGIERAEVRPFLFTRIKARMLRKNGWGKISSFISRPVIALAVLLPVIVINAVVVFNRGSENGTDTGINTVASSITEEYISTYTTIADYENTEDNELYQK